MADRLNLDAKQIVEALFNHPKGNRAQRRCKHVPSKESFRGSFLKPRYRVCVRCGLHLPFTPEETE